MATNCKCSCEEFESLCKCYWEEFEPLSKWHREKGCDILEGHLKDFKKEQLCVKINNLGILKIIGERPLYGTRRSRFYKEIKISKDCNTAEICAKLSNGVLCIMMPKKICNVTKVDSKIRQWCAEKKKLITIETDTLCRCNERQWCAEKKKLITTETDTLCRCNERQWCAEKKKLITTETETLCRCNERQWCAEKKKLITTETNTLCWCNKQTYLECGFESTTYPLAMKVTVAISVAVSVALATYVTYMCWKC